MLNFNPAIAANFNDDLREIRAEINRDNLQNAILKIKKIKITNEHEQEKIDFVKGILIYDQKTFTKGETHNKILPGNEELWSEIINPIVKENNLTSHFKLRKGARRSAILALDSETNTFKAISSPGALSLAERKFQTGIIANKKYIFLLGQNDLGIQPTI